METLHDGFSRKNINQGKRIWFLRMKSYIYHLALLVRRLFSKKLVYSLC